MLHITPQFDHIQRQQRTTGGGPAVCEVCPRFVQVLVQAEHQPRGSDRLAQERPTRDVRGARFDHVRQCVRAGGQGGASSARGTLEGTEQRGTGASLPGGTDHPRCTVEGLLERTGLHVPLGAGLPAFDYPVGAALPADHTGRGSSTNGLPIAGPAAATDARCRL